MSCGVGLRRSLDLALLWLWRRLAAVALVQPLAWKLLYATGVALKSKKKKKKKKAPPIFLEVYITICFLKLPMPPDCPVDLSERGYSFCLLVKKITAFKNPGSWSSHCGIVVKNPTSIHEDLG